MKTTWTVAQIHRLLSLFEPYDLLWDPAAPDGFGFAVSCNDVFTWGAADAEPITPADLDALEQARRDADGHPAWPALWVARKRRLRPQGAYLRTFPPGSPLVEHFLAAGPPRGPDVGNPAPFPAPASRKANP